jgi:Kae1-associated kinase Bud32
VNRLRGAEAVLSKTEIIGNNAIVKKRIAKSYRLKEIDEKLRRERTRSEARLLHKAKLVGVKCPTVLQVKEFEIVMSFLDGKRPEMESGNAKIAGEILAKLHSSNIIHGDYTPANLIENSEGIYVIDFGLGFISADIEDKAVDVFTMLRSISEKDAFLDGYRTYSNAESVLKRVKKVEKRVRYAN